MSADELLQKAIGAIRSGDRAGAAALLRRVLDDDPDHAGALMASAKMAQAAGEHQRALSLLGRLLESLPTSLSALVMQGRILHANGDHAAALAAFGKARSLAPDSDALAYNVGVQFYALAQYAAAAEAYTDAVRINPGNDDARRNRIMSLAGAGDIDAALAGCGDYLAARRGPPWRDGAPPPSLPALPEKERRTSRFKLTHDRQQFRYLADRGVAGDHRALADAFGQAIADVAHLAENELFDRRDRSGTHWQLIERFYNRPVYLPEPAALDGPLINPDLDVERLEAQYLGDGPPVTVVDDLLTLPALDALREFLRSATIWYDIKPNYLGAYFIEGFANRLTLGIAESLRLALPRVFGEHRLTQAWAYKYGPSLTGIPRHADAAAVNVNFWVAPGDSNLDPASGGLKVYTARAPADWDFARFNNDQAAIAELLERHGSDCVTVPHAENRAVIFHSGLFHETDRIDFRDDYLSRRINVTLLYGQRNA